MKFTNIYIVGSLLAGCSVYFASDFPVKIVSIFVQECP